jgi:hypothetical protein
MRIQISILGLCLGLALTACGDDDDTPPPPPPTDGGSSDLGTDAAPADLGTDMPGCPDADGDGATSAACGGSDCDDSDATRYPGAAEVCDGNDEDCDDTTFGTRDADGDGVVSNTCCNGTNCGLDCDDASLARRPGQLEVCDGLDNNCDGAVDETMNDAPWYPDTDGDLFGARGSTPVLSCTPVPGHSLVSTDCDDTRTGVSPLGIEMCNGRDDNCDGDVDEGCAGMDGGTGPADGGTGPADGGTGTFACDLPRSVTLADAAGAGGGDFTTTFENGVFGLTATTCVLDGERREVDFGLRVFRVGTVDGDPESYLGLRTSLGVVSASPTLRQVSRGNYEIAPNTDITLTVQLNSGFGSDYATVVLRYEPGVPSATEATVRVSAFTRAACSTRMADESVGGCDGVDSDCDGMTDEGVTVQYYVDGDRDGVGGGPSGAPVACGAPGGIGGCPGCPATVTISGDCDDFDATRSPLLPERCGGGDENCNGTTDELPAANTSCEQPFTTASCVSGACVISACATDYADCDGNAANGCETNTTTSNLHCGGCGMLCGDACTGGTCMETPVVDVAAGYGHACILKMSGRVLCTGRNDQGQLGSGTIAESTTDLVLVPEITDAVEIDAADERTCARLASGRVSCWGNGQPVPQLAQVITGPFSPAVVLEGASEISAGKNVIAIRFSDARFPGSTVAYTTSTPRTPSFTFLASFITISDISAGDSHGCAVDGTNGLLCLATSNLYGQLGNGTTTSSTTPLRVSGTSGVAYAEVAAGGDTTCARRSSGEISCWGFGEYGQIGDGFNMNRLTPVTVTGLTDVTQLAVGDRQVCAVRTGGTLSCWGQLSMLGMSTNTPTAVTTWPTGPGTTEPIGSIAKIDIEEVVCILRTDGTPKCVGEFPPPPGSP